MDIFADLRMAVCRHTGLKGESHERRVLHCIGQRGCGFRYICQWQTRGSFFKRVAGFLQPARPETDRRFFSLDASEFMDEFEDLEITDQEMQWFDAELGIEWINELIEALTSESSEVWINPVIEDLNEYNSIFEQARQIGAKWHFEQDI
jgi:hypothetical protein